MKKMLQLVLLKENYTEDKDGKTITYDRYFISLPDDNFKMNASLTNAFINKLENLNIEFPLLLTLTDKENDYHYARGNDEDNNDIFACKHDDDDDYDIYGLKIVIKNAREIVHFDKD